MGDLVFQHPRLVAQQADHLLLAGVGLEPGLGLADGRQLMPEAHCGTGTPVWFTLSQITGTR
jgi:hypothetical protein